MAFASKGIDWDGARQMFVETPERPTYEQIAQRFGCHVGAVGRMSADGGWPALRAQHMEAQLAKADAQSVILHAVKADRTIVTGFASFAVVTIARLTATVESIDDARAPQTKADAINTCTFAAKNLADALRSVGIIGVAKTLNEGKEANGQWNPEMLTQINLVVQTLAAKPGDPSAGVPMPTVVSPVPPAPAGGVSSDVPVELSVSCPPTR